MNNKLYPILLFALAAWGVCHLIAFVFGVSNPATLQFLGQYGDFFGWLNTLFSGLAMVGAVYAVLLQRQSLDDLQKQSLRERQHQEELNRLSKLEEVASHLNSWNQEMAEVALAASASVARGTDFDNANWFRLHHSRNIVQTIVEIHFPQISSELAEIDTERLVEAVKNALRKDAVPVVDVKNMYDVAFELSGKIYTLRRSLLAKQTDLIDAAKRPSAPSLLSAAPD